MVFGSEPRNCEVWDFVLKNYYGLRFSPAVEAAVKDGRVNPKWRQREAGRQTMQAGIGTKSQQALQREEWETERRQADREQREAEKERLFEWSKSNRYAELEVWIFYKS